MSYNTMRCERSVSAGHLPRSLSASQDFDRLRRQRSVWTVDMCVYRLIEHDVTTTSSAHCEHLNNTLILLPANEIIKDQAWF